MHNFRYMIFFWFFLCLTGCSIKPAINKDYNKNIDFTRYHTFAMAKDTSPYPDLLEQSISGAVTAELQKIGYALAENPDLFIHIYKSQQQKVDVVPDPMQPGFFGYNGRWAGGDDVYEYTEGTFVIDIVDSKTNDLIWRATVSKEIDDTNKHIPEQAIQQLIKTIFTPFP